MFRSRQYLVFFIFTAILFALLFRLFYLQVLNFEKFTDLASGQHNKVLKIEPRRGAIFDRYMEPLAINLEVPSVYGDPRNVADPEDVADALVEVLGVDRDMVLERLNRDKSFVWIKRKIDAEEAESIKSQGVKGVFFVTESERHYGNDRMACHVVGFAGMDNTGLEGLELLFDDKLKGKPGWRHLVRDAKRRTVLYNEKESMPAQNGHNLVLTIDSVVQFITEEELRKMAKKHNVSGASAIVMESCSGKILAMANYPDFDLNEFSQTPKSYMKNLSISSVYEPGSVFKIVTASASLEEGLVDLEDVIYCERGEYVTGGRVLHDFHEYGDLPFRDVIAKSSNIGTVKVAERMGKEELYRYIKLFGFGEKTGIDLPGEVVGINRPPSVWSASDITTIPIGQGIAVTPLQMACAMNVIASGGYLYKPYVVERITTWEGETFKEFLPQEKRRVISETTCEKMKDALSQVVSSGTGRRARSESFEACGKTGTAQMVNPEGGYYGNKYNATFVGFAPKEDPLVTILVTASDPHPVYFGGSVAGPVFKEIAERSIQYLTPQKLKNYDKTSE
ncbi:MAG: penicillin-binding protein [Candidatus Omnitrophica bacterium]|nr:penicillin-binding protein [Candidatus Omnitrophota bacterium]